jgi:phospholipid/cholesterol/gamma-HCH transport system permease protein
MPQSPSSLNRGLSELGGALIERPASWLRVLRFAGVALVTALSPSAWDATMRRAAAEQLHFSAWQPLPGFTLAAALLSYVMMLILEGAARGYGLSQYAPAMIMRVVLLELIPLGAALFVALRSGAAISTEVALMHIRGDLEALERSGKDPLRHEIMPRVIGSAVAVTLLCFLNCAVALLLAYFALYGFSPGGLDQFLRITGKVFYPQASIGLVLKTLLFGIAVAVIPITASLATPRLPRLAAVAVLRGMVRLMIALAVIEGVFLALQYG